MNQDLPVMLYAGKFLKQRQKNVIVHLYVKQLGLLRPNCLIYILTFKLDSHYRSGLASLSSRYWCIHMSGLLSVHHFPSLNTSGSHTTITTTTTTSTIY